MDRRRFLASLAGLAGATLLPGRARAGAAARNLVIVFAAGGWDTTWLYDPKPDSPFVDTGVGDWAPFGAGGLWFDPGRPAVTRFFERYGARACVINGMNVPSVAHGSCTQRILTGSRDAARPDIGAIVGYGAGQSSPMPYLDIGGNALPGVLGAEMGYLGPQNQLGGLFRREDAPRPPDRDSWARVFPEEAQFDAIRAYVEQRAGRFAGRGALGENQRRYDAFLSGLARSHQLRDFEDFFADVGRGRAFADQARIGVAALDSGLSRAIFLNAEGGFDTHQRNDDQIALYDATFDSLELLVDELAATPGAWLDSLLDETIVLVVSEMGRTPTRNAQDGKDHWPITSCLVLGAGIRGEQILGATDETLAALPIDPISGQPDELGVVLQPEHLHSALLLALGVDPEPWFPGVEPLRGLLV